MCELLDRRETFRGVRSPLSRRALARRQAELAHEAWLAGDFNKARRHLARAVYYDPQSRDINDLRRRILNGAAAPGPPAFAAPTPAVGPEPIPLDEEELPPWLVEDLVAPRDANLPGPSTRPRNPGMPGRSQPIVRPERKP